jgi:nucleotide-binding universal stress UspA family protein
MFTFFMKHYSRDDTMFKHILVPLDGSAMAEAALPAAAFLAKKLDAMTTLFHVIERNAPRAVHGQTHLQHVEEAVNYLAVTASRAFPEDVRVDCHVHESEADSVAESIVEHMDELNPDIIIMCSHGRGKALHLFLGSIAQKVVSMGSLPVLITHPGKEGDIPVFSCKTLLLPLDGNPDHEQALPVSKELAGVCGASLHLAVVIPSYGALSGQRVVTSRFLPGTMSKLLEISVENSEAYLQSLLETIRGQGFVASAHVLRGDPATVIINSAQQSQIDLIVLATHGRTGMEAFWKGSVTHKICSRSRIPLLLIPVEN